MSPWLPMENFTKSFLNDLFLVKFQSNFYLWCIGNESIIVDRWNGTILLVKKKKKKKIWRWRWRWRWWRTRSRKRQRGRTTSSNKKTNIRERHVDVSLTCFISRSSLYSGKLSTFHLWHAWCCHFFLSSLLLIFPSCSKRLRSSY